MHFIVDVIERVAQGVTEDATDCQPRFRKVYAASAREAIGEARLAYEAERPVHPFERAGLGKAPFRYAGMECQDLCYGEAILNRAEYERTGIRLTTKPGGTCAYCGTYIIAMFNIASADGKRFHVGSDCVAKIATDDAALAAKVETAAKKAARSRRHAREASLIQAGKVLLADDAARAVLATLPHLLAWRAKQGGTLLEWADWSMMNARTTGRVRVARIIQRELARKASA